MVGFILAAIGGVGRVDSLVEEGEGEGEDGEGLVALGGRVWAGL